MNRLERNYNCRITEYEIYGKKAVSMENSRLRLGILAGKGADIYEFLDKETDTDFMFRDPGGLKKLAGYIPSAFSDKGNFWNYTVGGWYELFPNAGKGCTHRGALIGQHGEVHLMPWDYTILKNEPEEIIIVFYTRTFSLPLSIEKTVTLRDKSPCVFIEEKITNIGDSPVDYLWGHHITFGEAFLNENCIITLPGGRVHKRDPYDTATTRLTADATGRLEQMPGEGGRLIDMRKLLPKNSGVGEMLFIDELDECWYSITDTKKDLGIGVSWDQKAFPYLWLWQEFNSVSDFPWYKQVYAMALELQSSIVPILSEAVKAGSHSVIGPGEIKSSWITAVIIKNNKEVKGIEKNGEVKT